MSAEAGATPMTLGRVLDQGAWSGFQKRVLAYAALIFLVDGLANQSLGIVQPALIEAWGVPRDAFAPVQALGLTGVAIGTAVGGILGDRFGRKTILIASMVLFGLMTAAGALTTDTTSLMIVRFLDGLGIGGAIPCGAALIAEFTPIRRRSLAIAIGMAFIPVGGLVSGVMGGAVLSQPDIGWQGMFIACGALAVGLALALVFLLPESPGFLTGRPTRTAELAALQRKLDARGDALPLATPPEKRPKASLTELLGEGRLRDSILLWAAFFLCLMASYSIFGWLPTMLREAGFDPVRTSNSLTAFHTGGLAGGLVCGVLITAFGSRPAYILVAGGGVIGAIVMAGFVAQPDPDATVLLSVMVVEGLLIGGIHTAVYTHAAHLYPPSVRATGVGSASAVGRIGAILSAFTATAALNLGRPAFFLVIAGLLAACLLCGVFISNQIRPSKRQGG